MKTVVLDDDPTGTQSATGVRVLLRWDADRLAAALDEVDAVYLQTNSRAVDEPAAAVEQVARGMRHPAPDQARFGNCRARNWRGVEPTAWRNA